MAIEIIESYSPAAERLIKALRTDLWMTRAEIAEALGKPRLIPNDIRALEQLAKRDVIDLRIEKKGEAVYSYYRGKA